MGLRWAGFRRVRRQVCKRLGRRMAELGLGSADEYRSFLGSHPGEWPLLDSLCWISISRFFRDRIVFEALGRTLLPALARTAAQRGDAILRAWSAGCASGEEPYSLKLVWELEVRPRHPGLDLQITATDADPNLLRRARRGCYAGSSLKELPRGWRERCFRRIDSLYALRPQFREGIEFRCEDVRRRWPGGPFDLVLCRNLAFTYFAPALQAEVLSRIRERLVRGGALIVGGHEVLPHPTPGFVRAESPRGVYHRK
jgi:chemotaxis protein methyltransferase CheR